MWYGTKASHQLITPLVDTVIMWAYETAMLGHWQNYQVCPSLLWITNLPVFIAYLIYISNLQPPLSAVHGRQRGTHSKGYLGCKYPCILFLRCKYALASWGRGCALSGRTNLNYFSLPSFKLIPNAYYSEFISNLHVKFLFDWTLT